MRQDEGQAKEERRRKGGVNVGRYECLRNSMILDRRGGFTKKRGYREAIPSGKKGDYFDLAFVLGNFLPGVFKGDGSIEDWFFSGCIGIDIKVTNSFKLEMA